MNVGVEGAIQSWEVALIALATLGLCTICCICGMCIRRNNKKSQGLLYLSAEGGAAAGGVGPMLRLQDATADANDAPTCTGAGGRAKVQPTAEQRHRGDTALHTGARAGLMPKGGRNAVPMFKQFDVEVGEGDERMSMGSQLAKQRWKGAATAAQQEAAVRTGGAKRGSIEGGLMSSQI